MRPLASAGIALALAALAACGGKRPAGPAEVALVAVEVLQGAAQRRTPLPRVALLIDASASMRAPAVVGVSRLAAAKARAIDVLAMLPPATRVSIDAVGIEAAEGCHAAKPILSPSAPGDLARAAVDPLEPGGEGSIAEALQATILALAAEGTIDGAHIVAFTDLEGPCGGDLCAAVGRLASSGASLDLVVLGGQPTPACVANATAATGPPPDLLSRARLWRFQVLPAAGGGVYGVSGGRPVLAPPGPARIEVLLDPPLEVGPVTLEPDTLLRLRVLDFPAGIPPVREWSFEVVGAGGSQTSSPTPSSPASP